MHILYFPTRFYPAISGGDFYMQRLAEEIQRQRNEVIIFSTTAIDFAGINGKGKKVDPNHKNFSQFKNLHIIRWKADPIEETTIAKIDSYCNRLETLYSIPAQLISFFIKQGPFLPDLLDSILLKDNHYCENLNNVKISFNEIELIHTTYLPYANLLYSILLGLKFQIPCVVTPFLHYENIRYQAKEIFHLLSFFDLIFACTEYEKHILIEYGVEQPKIKVLPMGVDITKFQKDCRNSFENLYYKPEKALIFSGNKNYEKGALTILKTIPYLWPMFPELTYIMIGPSTSAYNYQLNHIKKEYPNVKIINISPDNLSGIYDPIKIGAFQSADLYCMPSRSDAYGIAYLEGWAVKIPPIAAKFPAMEEIISKDSGILVEFDNPEALANGIIYLLSNHSIRQEMGEIGFQKIKIENSWHQIAQKTLGFYKEIIEIKKSFRSEMNE